jgi:hypothetical protein
MKRNISDLLDNLPVEDIELEKMSLLSARRIKKKTMNKIVAPKSRNVRWLWRVAAVAAVILALSVSVFAADMVWNDGELLSVFFGDNLSDDEVALVEKIGKDMEQSVTQNGATITAVQAIADESFCWLHLRVEAPEGTVLRDLDNDLYYYSFAGVYLTEFQVQHRYTADDQWKMLAYAHSVKPLKDADPNDNVKEFILTVHGDEGKNIFRRSGETRMVIPGLYIIKGKSPEKETLFTGKYVFDISMDHVERNDIKKVIDTAGVSFYNEEYDYTTTVKKVTISPLHLEVDFSTTPLNAPYIFAYGGPIDLVMKDGSKIHVLDAWFDAKNQNVVDPDDVVGPRITYFTTPIVIENVDYIIVGGEHEFDVN